MKWYITLILVVVVAFVGLFVYYLFDTGQLAPVSYKDCGTGRDCIESAIYDCEPATATVSGTKVTVRGVRKAIGQIGGVTGTAHLCEVNFDHGNKMSTCAIPIGLTKQYSIEQYEYEMEKFCASGNSPPSSTK